MMMSAASPQQIVTVPKTHRLSLLIEKLKLQVTLIQDKPSKHDRSMLKVLLELLDQYKRFPEQRTKQSCLRLYGYLVHNLRHDPISKPIVTVYLKQAALSDSSLAVAVMRSGLCKHKNSGLTQDDLIAIYNAQHPAIESYRDRTQHKRLEDVFEAARSKYLEKKPPLNLAANATVVAVDVKAVGSPRIHTDAEGAARGIPISNAEVTELAALIQQLRPQIKTQVNPTDQDALRSLQRKLGAFDAKPEARKNLDYVVIYGYLIHNLRKVQRQFNNRYLKLAALYNGHVAILIMRSGLCVIDRADLKEIYAVHRLAIDSYREQKPHKRLEPNFEKARAEYWAEMAPTQTTMPTKDGDTATMMDAKSMGQNDVKVVLGVTTTTTFTATVAGQAGLTAATTTSTSTTTIAVPMLALSSHQQISKMMPPVGALGFKAAAVDTAGPLSIAKQQLGTANAPECKLFEDGRLLDIYNDNLRAPHAAEFKQFVSHAANLNEYARLSALSHADKRDILQNPDKATLKGILIAQHGRDSETAEFLLTYDALRANDIQLPECSEVRQISREKLEQAELRQRDQAMFVLQTSLARLLTPNRVLKLYDFICTKSHGMTVPASLFCEYASGVIAKHLQAKIAVTTEMPVLLPPAQQQFNLNT